MRFGGQGIGRIAPLTVVVAVLAACDDPGIEERRVAKGVEPPREQWWTTAAAPEPEPSRAATPEWTLPEGWTRGEGETPARIATFLAPAGDATVEVAVTRFPGQVGGELANVNRWRSQLGRPPIEPEDLGREIERFSSPGFTGYVARIDADEQALLAVAIHDQGPDHTWFVRAVDAPARVSAIEDELTRFARSIAGGGGDR